MKKSIIAAGATAAVLAAMPVLGTFAAQNSFTDTLTVTVEGGCTLQNSQDTTPGTFTHSDRAFTQTIPVGTVGYLNADNTGAATSAQGTVSISCNSTDGTKTWTVGLGVDGLTDSNINKTIAGGTAINGATSAWAIKSNVSGLSANGVDNFSDYAAAATATTFLSDKAGSTTVTFNPTYRVYVAPTQDPGTYIGHATYTITLGN